MADGDFTAVASPDFALTKPSDAELRRRTQSFGRFEFKYVISARVCVEIERDVSRFMELDPFCRERPTRDYVVRSLYFDDPAFSAYYQKIDGVVNRSKYRLRTYGPGEDGPCFLEIKGRANNFSYKHRMLLPRHVRERLTAQDWAWVLAHAREGDMLTRFATSALRRRLRSRVVVEYARRPYISARDYRFRATFDNRLVGIPASTLDARYARRQPVLRGQSVLEIKFEQAVPSWFQRLIGAYELRRVSISKYCRAAEELGVVTNLE